MRVAVSAVLAITSLLLYAIVVLVATDGNYFFPLAPVASQVSTVLLAGYTSSHRPHPYVLFGLLFWSLTGNWVAAGMFTNEQERSFCHPLYWTPEATAPGPFLRIHSAFRCKDLVRAVVCLVWINSAVQLVFTLTGALAAVVEHLQRPRSSLVIFPVPALGAMLLLTLGSIASVVTLRTVYLPMVGLTLFLYPVAYLVGHLLGTGNGSILMLLALPMVFVPTGTCHHPVTTVTVRDDPTCVRLLPFLQAMKWILGGLCLFMATETPVTWHKFPRSAGPSRGGGDVSSPRRRERGEERPGKTNRKHIDS